MAYCNTKQGLIGKVREYAIRTIPGVQGQVGEKIVKANLTRVARKVVGQFSEEEKQAVDVDHPEWPTWVAGALCLWWKNPQAQMTIAPDVENGERGNKTVGSGDRFVVFHEDFITPQKESKADRSLMNMCVQRLSGDVCELQFRSDATIIDVKQEIEAVWGVRNEAQTMMIGDQAVGNTSSVGSLIRTSCDSQGLALTLIVDYSFFKRQFEALDAQFREAVAFRDFCHAKELDKKIDDLVRSLPAGALQ